MANKATDTSGEMQHPHSHQDSSLQSESASGLRIHNLYEPNTGSVQYIVADANSRMAIIIDPVLDMDTATFSLSTKSADALLSIIKTNKYQIKYILETHAHADHITAASYLQNRLTSIQGQDQKPLIGIGKRIVLVQERFGQRYHLSQDQYQNVFDKLFDDDEELHVGSFKIKILNLPGHTPDHIGYKIEDNIFVGDSIFHAELGSARADFPGGSAKALYASGKKLLGLHEDVKIWIGHDYPGNGRAGPEPCMTVQHHRANNKHLKDGISEEAFIQLREARDATLSEPKLIHLALQMNIRAGRLPEPTQQGDRFLSVPLKVNGVVW